MSTEKTLGIKYNMSAELAPEERKWLTHVADVARGGNYAEDDRLRSKAYSEMNGTFGEAGLYGEGGRERDVVDEDNVSHNVKVVGYITINSPESALNTEFLFTKEHGIFYLVFKTGQAGRVAARFIDVEHVDQLLEDAIHG